MAQQRTPFDHLLYHHVTEALSVRKTWRSFYIALAQHGVTYAVVQERRFLGARQERGAFFFADGRGEPTHLLAMAREVHPAFDIEVLERDVLGRYVAPDDLTADHERGVYRPPWAFGSRDRDRAAQRAYDGRGRGLSADTVSRLAEYARGPGRERYEAHISPLFRDLSHAPARSPDGVGWTSLPYGPVERMLDRAATESLDRSFSWRDLQDSLAEHGMVYEAGVVRGPGGAEEYRGAFFYADGNGEPLALVAMARDVNPGLDIDALESFLGPMGDRPERAEFAQRALDAGEGGMPAGMRARIEEYARTGSRDVHLRHMASLAARDRRRERGPGDGREPLGRAAVFAPPERERDRGADRGL